LNSRWRLIANWIIDAAIGATMIMASAAIGLQLSRTSRTRDWT